VLRLGSHTGFGQLTEDDKIITSSGKRIFVGAGQSNELGQGTAASITIVSGYTSAYSSVTLKQQTATTANDPLTWTLWATAALAPRAGSPNFGPELSFGRYMDRVDPANTAIAKMAINGSSLALNWLPSVTYPTSGDTLFTQFVAYLQEAETELEGRLAAIHWVQGEADAGNATHAANYQANLTAFVEALRVYWPGIPFVFNQLHASASPAHTATVRTQQAAFAAAVPNVAMVNVDDLTLTDGLHFDADSYVTLGNRLALATAQLLGLNVPPVASFSFDSTGLTVDFTDESTDDDGTIVSRLWDFGDGQTSTATNPSHTYATGGTYDVTLTITDSSGDTDSDEQPVGLNSFTVDATSGWATPQDLAELNALLAAANATLTSLGQATITATPIAGLKCNELSGNLTDYVSGKTFTASGTGLAYNIDASAYGWAQNGVFTSDNATGAFRCTDAALPDIATGAVYQFAIIVRTTATALNRSVLTAGTGPVHWCGGQTALRCNSGTNTSSGAVNTMGAAHVVVLESNKAGGRTAAYDSDNESVPTNSATPTGKGIGLGAMAGTVNSSGAIYLNYFALSGAMSQIQIQVLQETIGDTCTWTP
jgi:PKD repeat protein